MPRFFEFLSLEHSNNNVHNIRLCRLVIVNADLTSVELADMQVADKVRMPNGLSTHNKQLCNTFCVTPPACRCSHVLASRLRELPAAERS